MFLRHHVHSIYSSRDGMLKLETIIEHAKQHNEAFAICDHGSNAGWIDLYNQCKKHNIKPIFGIEMYINPHRNRLFQIVEQIETEQDAHIKKQLQEERDNIKSHHHIVLIAKNQNGFHNLIELSNIAYVDGFYSRPSITYDELFKHKDGLIVTSACLGGTINRYYVEKRYKEAEQYVNMMKNIFGDDFYLEVQANGIIEQKSLNQYLIKLSEKYQVKMCIGSDSHYLDEDWKDAHQDLLLLQGKHKREDVGKFDVQITYENNKGEVKTRKIHPDKKFRGNVIAKDIHIGDTFGKDTIVSVDKVSRVWSFSGDAMYLSENDIRKYVTKNHKELISYIDNIIESNKEMYDKIDQIEINTDIKLPTVDNAYKQLVNLVKIGLKEKGLTSKKYIDRAKYELKVIKENGFSEYFIILQDFIQFAINRDIPCGAGRGSGVSSLVGYAIGIHRVNPLDKRWGGMPFERFLQAGRNNNKIIIEGDEAKLEFFDIDLVKIKRKAEELVIEAQDIKEGDDFICEVERRIK